MIIFQNKFCIILLVLVQEDEWQGTIKQEFQTNDFQEFYEQIVDLLNSMIQHGIIDSANQILEAYKINNLHVQPQFKGLNHNQIIASFLHYLLHSRFIKDAKILKFYDTRYDQITKFITKLYNNADEYEVDVQIQNDDQLSTIYTRIIQLKPNIDQKFNDIQETQQFS
ncbi:hypothetical protein pb186bvf_003331 [Paramecium bursaria]